VSLARRARRRIEEDFDARTNGARMRQIVSDVHARRALAAVPAAEAV
jgi:hypothetical protein